MIGGGFTMVPNAVLDGRIKRADGQPLSHGARLLYAQVLNFSNCGTRPCMASQETLAGRLNVSTRTIRAYRRELEDARLISVRREGRTVTNTIAPLVLPERKSASGHDRKSASDEQDLQGNDNDDITVRVRSAGAATSAGGNDKAARA